MELVSLAFHDYAKKLRELGAEGEEWAEEVFRLDEEIWAEVQAALRRDRK